MHCRFEGLRFASQVAWAESMQVDMRVDIQVPPQTEPEGVTVVGGAGITQRLGLQPTVHAPQARTPLSS